MTTDISESSEELELFHYGIKGMKWGVRRPDGPDGTVSSRVRRKEKREAKATAKSEARGGDEKWKRPVSEDAKNANNKRTRIKKHGTDAIDNKELKQLVNRMNLEQQYSSLVENQKASSKRRGAQSYVSDILKDAGKQAATEGVKWAATQAVKYAFNQATGGGKNSGGTATAYKVPTNLLTAKPLQIGR